MSLNTGERAIFIEESEILELVRDHETTIFGKENCPLSNQPYEILFLKELITRGQWNFVEELILPLKGREDHTHASFLMYQQIYLEMLYRNSEQRDEKGLKKVLKKLVALSPSQDKYKSLHYLLSLPSLSSHPDYKDWKPDTSRQTLFNKLAAYMYKNIFPSTHQPSTNDSLQSRLIQLVARGLLYEQCESMCIRRHKLEQLPNHHVLDLLSWLTELPHTHTPPLSIPVQIVPMAVKSDNTLLSCHHQSMICGNKVENSSFLSKSAPEKFWMLQNSTFQHRVSKTSPENIQCPSTPAHILTDDSLPRTSTPKHPISRKDLLKSTNSALFTPITLHPVTRRPKNTQISPGLKSERDVVAHLVSSIKDKHAIRSVSFSPDGKQVAIGPNSKVLHILDATPLLTHSHESTLCDLPELYIERFYHQGSIYSLSWNSSSSILASGSNDHSVKLLYSGTSDHYEPCGTINALEGTVRELDFISNGHLLCGGGGHYPLKLIDCENQVVAQYLTGHDQHVLSVCSVNEQMVASCGEDSTVRLWDIRTPFSPIYVHSHHHTVTSISSHKDCLSFATISGECFTLCLTTHKILNEWKPHTGECRSLRYSPCGQWLLTSSYDGTVCLTKTETSNFHTICKHKDKVIQARWHPSGKSIATTSADKTACFWSLNNNNM